MIMFIFSRFLILFVSNDTLFMQLYIKSLNGKVL